MLIETIEDNVQTFIIDFLRSKTSRTLNRQPVKTVEIKIKVLIMPRRLSRRRNKWWRTFYFLLKMENSGCRINVGKFLHSHVNGAEMKEAEKSRKLL